MKESELRSVSDLGLKLRRPCLALEMQSESVYSAGLELKDRKKIGRLFIDTGKPRN